LAPLLGNERAAQVVTLENLLQAQQIIDVSVATSFAEGVDGALARLSAGDRLVVFGSFFTVAAAMTVFADPVGIETTVMGESKL
jgi:dihydrofolate synthase/folylpolyglutamate synthase